MNMRVVRPAPNLDLQPGKSPDLIRENLFRMKQLPLLFIFIAIASYSQAQLGNFGNKLKNAAKNKAEDKSVEKTSETVDKGFESIFKNRGKKDIPSGTTSSEKGNEGGGNRPDNVETVREKASTISAYSKFDFIPGEKTLYAEDFSQDAIGELPQSWNTTGKGEIMTIDGKEGNWLRGYQNNMLLSGNTREFGENYTIEFDLIYFMEAKPEYSFPDLDFGILGTKDLPTNDNSILNNAVRFNMVQVHIHPHEDTKAYVESFYEGRETYQSDWVQILPFYRTLNTMHHYSIQVQKTRFRCWMDEKKLFDVPRGVNTQDKMNQFFLKLAGSSYGDDQVGYYLTNIRIATGVPDSRHKLVEEGKFSTNGILFAVNSAVIKPESYAVVKEIGLILKENPALKVYINGHTSSDGNPKVNMELSRQRAIAVKAMLAKEFGIADDRMQAEGMGDKVPVADNKTQEGRVQNRRVEFIKI